MGLVERLRTNRDYMGKHSDGICRLEAECLDEAADALEAALEALEVAKKRVETGLEYMIESANEDGRKYGNTSQVFLQEMRDIERAEQAIEQIDNAINLIRGGC